LNVAELAAFVEAPVLRSAAGDVDISLAGRTTFSSEYGVAPNFEALVRYSPTEAIELFGQVHVGRRPPNIVEMFSAGPSAYESFVDPCAHFASVSVVAENCFGGGPLGVAPGFTQTAPLARAGMVGNPGLDPERVFSQGYGVSVTPAEMMRLPGRLKLTAAWFSYELRDLIRQPSDPLFDCYLSNNLSAPDCGANPFTGLPLIRRDPASGQIVEIGAILRNHGAYEWQGVDLGFDYVVEPTGLGPIDRLWLNGLHTIALKVETQEPGDAEPKNLLGLVRNPKHRSLVSMGGQAGPVTVNVFLQRRGTTDTVRHSGVEAATIPPITLVDLTVRYQVREDIFVTFGAENLADRVAPIVAFPEFTNTFPEHFDLVGRRFSMGIQGAF
jgi:outer membrane receptor protein involved in Fe transport